MRDMNGVLGLLHTLNAPFFADENYAEAELLRIYGMVMLCKFNEANKGIDNFPVRFGPQQNDLTTFSEKTPEELFELIRAEVNGNDTDLPYTISRRYKQEDRMLGAVNSVSAAEDEASRIKALDGSKLASTVTEWVSSRKESIIQTEGNRVRKDLQQQAQNLKNQMVSLEISKLDILDMEGQLLNRAAETGKLEEARKQVRRNKRINSDEQVWEYQGEFWADEVGYYRLNTKSECPSSINQ